MRVVDAHVHVLDLSTGLYPAFETPSVSFIGDNAPICRSYLLEELLAEGGGDIEIAKIVNVEALPTDRVAETRHLQGLADRTGFPQAIVAGADLSLRGAAREIETQASFRNVRGIRHILNVHPDPAYTYMTEDFLLNPVWQGNFGLLRRFDLSFDMQLYPHQMEHGVALAARHPDVQVVVNHAGMFADRGLAGWRTWRDGMRALSERPNVAVKISGLGMFDHGWTIESLRPYVLETLDAFGTERAMFASNFPVDKLFGTYVDTWRAFAATVADLSADETTALLATNAERIYKI